MLNEDARIFLFHNFLSPEEADHIVSLAQPRLHRSAVVDTSTGGSEVSKIRTSQGTFLDRGEDAIVADIERRIARWTLMPVGNGEGLQVLHYGHDQKYDAHWDYFFHKDGVKNGGNRYSTVLMYLADTEFGGETVFPQIPAPNGDNGPTYSDCARKHLAAKPRKGDAVLFHSIGPDGELERRSLHTACPVVRGEKWSAAKWIHVGHFALGNERPKEIHQHVQPKHVGCKDADSKCAEWAAQGECDNNPAFMDTQCPESCGKC